MKIKSISLRTRYLISYIGITACTCVVIGLLVMLHFSSEMYTAAMQDYQAKLTLAANDMQVQQDILMNITHRVKTSPQYRPFFTSRNAYYEVDIVEDIAKYENYSPVVGEYYILLSHSESVYSKHGKLSLDEFLHYRLGVRDGLLAKETFLSSPAFWTMAHPTQPGVLMALAPLRIASTTQGNSPDACMIFMISHQDLRQRLERISGLPPIATDGLAIYLGDTLIYGDAKAEGTPGVSDSGSYTVQSTADIAQVYPRVASFRTYYLLLLAVLTAVLVCLAAVLAIRSYRPINDIISTLNITPSSSAEDVEKAVKALQDSQRYNKEQLRRELQTIADQRRAIAKQLLFAKLNTAHDEKLDALMREAGIILAHPLFCVLVVRCTGQEVTEGKIAALANAMSDDDITVFSAGMYQPAGFLLLLNLSAHGQEEEASAIVRESLELEGIEADIQAGDVCGDVSQLHLSFVSALTRQPNAMPLPAAMPGSLPNWYDDKAVVLLLDALREGNKPRAHAALDAAADAICTQYPSALFQRSICADIINHLMKLMRELSMPLDSPALYGILVAADMESFRRAIGAGLLDEICETSLRRREETTDEQEHLVTAYIQQHLFASDFSIFQVAGHFGLSDRKVGSIVKRITGRTYKEYIIDLRINRARELLAEKQLNVSQTGESVGYSNIPYFIKLFRNHTGYTPGEYKKMHER